jgi:hypothetical protein
MEHHETVDFGHEIPFHLAHILFYRFDVGPDISDLKPEFRPDSLNLGSEIRPDRGDF